VVHGTDKIALKHSRPYNRIMAANDEVDLGPLTPSLSYLNMQPKWQKIQHLLDGTEAMRGAGQEYLPQHDGESNKAYDERLRKSTLLNMLQMTLDSWTGKPFSSPINTSDAAPEITDLLDNIDLQGNNLDVFSRNWFRDGLAKGFSHVLIDFPKIDPKEDGQPRTLADDNADKMRPYFVHIRPENLIFANREIVQGVETITHARILESHIVMDGWGEKVVRRIRALDLGLVTIYEERPDPEDPKEMIWVEIETYPYDLPFIPLVTFYSERSDFMESKPPLEDLADLNILHWQSKSDQISVLTVARFPMLAISGGMPEDKLVIGPNQWLNTPDPMGKFYYVEHSGKAINAGRQDLLDIESVMSEYGAIFLQKRPGGAAATATALKTAEITSPLQDMAIRFHASLVQAMKVMAVWLKSDPDNVGTFVINTDFGMDSGDIAHLTALQGARQLKDISGVRFRKELVKFNILGDDFTEEDNQKELNTEQKQQLQQQIQQQKQMIDAGVVKDPTILPPAPTLPAPGSPAAKGALSKEQSEENPGQNKNQ
jgi:hypothetical protein